MTKKIINYTLLIVLFLLPIVIYTPGFLESNSYIPKIVLLYSCGIILLICLIIKNRELEFDMFDNLLFVFIWFATLSTILSIDMTQSLFGAKNRYEGLFTFICYILIYYSAKNYFKFDKKVLNISLIIIFFLSILGILQYYNVPIIFDIFQKNYYGLSFAGATFGNRNFFGSFISMYLPFIMCLYIFYNKKIYLLLSLFSFYALLVCLTRSSWLAFFVFSLIGFIYVLKRKDKQLLKKCAILLTGFIMLFVVFYFSETNLFLDKVKSTTTDVSSTINSEENKNAASGRFLIWKYAIEIIKDHPLVGCGIDTFLIELQENHYEGLYYEIYPVLDAVPDKAHNEYLHMGATMGLPALIIHLTFISMTLKKLIKSDFIKSQQSFIVFLCLISYLVQAFFNISTIGVAPIFYFLLGYSHQLKNSKDLTNLKTQND